MSRNPGEIRTYVFLFGVFVGGGWKFDVRVRVYVCVSVRL